MKEYYIYYFGSLSYQIIILFLWNWDKPEMDFDMVKKEESKLKKWKFKREIESIEKNLKIVHDFKYILFYYGCLLPESSDLITVIGTWLDFNIAFKVIKSDLGIS